jgi:hypothetical protein
MSLPTTSPLRRVVVLASALLLAASGCSSLGNFRLGQERIPQASPKNPIVQVLAMWQPGEGPGIDNKTTRGFVGTLYFFTSKSPIAAKTNGSVSVYLFDDQGEEEEQVKPLHHFIWESKDISQLGQPGKLGQSYTIFIPYTRPGFHKAQCSLRVTYTPDAGSPVNSEMAYVALPGRKYRDHQDSDQAGLKQRKRPRTSEDEEDAGTPEIRSLDMGRSNRTALPHSELARRIESIDLTALRKPKDSPALSAAPLNERERARIIRELQQQGEEFAVAEEAAPASRRSPARRKVVLANYTELDEAEEFVDEFEDDEQESPPVARQQGNAARFDRSRQSPPRTDSRGQDRDRLLRRRVVSASDEWPETAED